MTFKISADNRKEWLQLNNPTGGPFFYGLLNQKQKIILEDWISETTANNMIGECGIPAMGILLGLILANDIRRVVQCGHYAGFSLLILSMLMKNAYNNSCIVSIDIDQVVTRFAQSYIDRAQLNDTAKLLVMDSGDPYCAVEALSQMHNQPPQLVFIDSSHQYKHTLEELNLWASVIQPGGFIVTHDASRMASNYDRNNLGGVRRALDEWLPRHPDVSSIIIDPEMGLQEQPTYKDPCGLALIHVKKPQPFNGASATKRRLIYDPGFHHRDNWLLGDGWTFAGRGVLHEPGSSSSVSCFSPVVGGETYKIEVELAKVISGGVHPGAGGGGTYGIYE